MAGEGRILYHATSLEIAADIHVTGFRRGTRGMFGPGVYFAQTPECARHKALTSCPNERVVVLKCKVNVGREKKIYGPHRNEYYSLNFQKVRSEGYDSIYALSREDGGCVTTPEWVIYEPWRVQLLSEEFEEPRLEREYMARLLCNPNDTNRYSSTVYGDPHACPHCGPGRILVPLDDNDPMATCGRCNRQFERPIKSHYSQFM